MEVKGRLLGIDFGEKRVGVAVSDQGQVIATALEVFEPKGNAGALVTRIAELIKEFDVQGVVVGWPLNLDGSAGTMCEKVSGFVSELAQRTGILIALWDERLSSSASENILISADVSRKKRKKVLDKVAAAYILQGALDFLESFRMGGNQWKSLD